MSERLAVDSLMTADGEVVQLPTLGPLGRPGPCAQEVEEG